ASPAAGSGSCALGDEAGAPAPRDGAGLAPGPGRVLGQFRASFIVAADDRGLVLIDQHTAHERILYEKLAREGRAGQEVQRLLIPEVIELPAASAAALEEGLPALAELGI